MKKLFFILSIINLATYYNANYLQPEAKEECAHTFSSISNTLSIKKTITTGRLYFAPIAICLMFICNTKNIITSILNYPLSSIALSGFLFQYTTDAYIKYVQICQIIDLFNISKLLCRYILYARAIKNTMLSQPYINFSEYSFYNDLMSQTPLSFIELEKFSHNLMQACIRSMRNFNINIHTDLEETMSLLCEEHVTLQNLLSCYENIDPEIFPKLKIFNIDPINNYTDTVSTLNNLIKNNITDIIKYQYHI